MAELSSVKLVENRLRCIVEGAMAKAPIISSTLLSRRLLRSWRLACFDHGMQMQGRWTKSRSSSTSARATPCSKMAYA